MAAIKPGSIIMTVVPSSNRLIQPPVPAGAFGEYVRQETPKHSKDLHIHRCLINGRFNPFHPSGAWKLKRSAFIVISEPPEQKDVTTDTPVEDEVTA